MDNSEDNPCTIVPNDFQTSDNWYKKKYQKVINHLDRYPDWKVEGSHLYFHHINLADPLLDDTSMWNLVIPQEQQEKILAENHDRLEAGHFGISKTYARISTRYFWPGMFRIVVQHSSLSHLPVQQE